MSCAVVVARPARVPGACLHGWAVDELRSSALVQRAYGCAAKHGAAKHTEIVEAVAC